MNKEELNACLKSFYTSARKQDGQFYKSSSLKAIRAAIDRYPHMPSPLGVNILDSMLKLMSSRAGIQPHLTNHCLRATAVIVLSDNNCETRHSKSVIGHKSDNSIESHNDRPSLDQQKKMSEALSSFLYGHEATSADKENTAERQLTTSPSTTAIQASPASVLVQRARAASLSSSI